MLPLIILPLCSSLSAPPRPRSRAASRSTALASLLTLSESSWKSSWASWCSREENRVEALLNDDVDEEEGKGDESAVMSSRGRSAAGDARGVLSAVFAIHIVIEKQRCMYWMRQKSGRTNQHVSESVYDGRRNVERFSLLVNLVDVWLQVCERRHCLPSSNSNPENEIERQIC